MARPLIDLLWRDHPDAPGRGARGPRSRVSTGEVVVAAIRLADADGLDAVTVRRLGDLLALSPMSIYTHVNSRDDLLVLMADQAYAEMSLPAYGRAGWKTRVRRLADAELALLRQRPWLLAISDQRTAVGPGTIARYDHELAAFDPTDLDDVTRDAALTFLLDYVRAAARSEVGGDADMTAFWTDAAPRLGAYMGDAFPLARRVGAAAGEAMQGPYSSEHAWRFGLERVISGLAGLID